MHGMHIIVTGDNHVDFLIGSGSAAYVLRKQMAEHSPDLVINLGDMSNGRLFSDKGLESLLLDGVYVLGNHDLWSRHERSKLPLDKSFDAASAWLKKFPAVQLEKSFDDRDTVVIDESKGFAVVGTIGLPDFSHPRFVMPKEYYDKRHCTNDATYINLSKGWLKHTHKVLDSFAERLEKAASSAAKEVIVCTHYPIFDGQARTSGDDVSAYFFCHEAGQMVLKTAASHGDKRFWCFAAHSHDYCRGMMSVEANNVVSYGLVAEYGRMTFVTVDTDLGFDQSPPATWCPAKCTMVVESVESRN